jgi:hypothetical protein
VQPAPGVANPLDQLPFDERVHIFVRAGHPGGIGLPFREDVLQRRDDGGGVSCRERASPLQRLGPCQAADHVVFEETPIESERRAEIEYCGVGLAVEAAGPEIGHEDVIPEIRWPDGRRQYLLSRAL